MPADPSRPPNRAWRNDAKPSERKNEAQKAWRREPAAPGPKRTGLSKRAKLGMVGLASLALVGGIIWVIWWLWPIKPVFVVIISDSYAENLPVPPNVAGAMAAKQFEDLTENNKGQFEVKRATPAAWQSTLETFRKEGREKTIVVCLALHGGADKKGPFLILDAGTPGLTRLPIKDVLQELGKLPADKNKLLILDATQVRSARRLMTYNDFSQQLKRLDDDIRKIPKLVVLNSTDAFQRSWGSEEWRQTVFGFYLNEGLQGGANNGKGRVTAWELSQFVRQKVERWAHDNRDAAQTPVLLPAGDEGQRRAQAIELAVVEKEYQPAPVPQPAPLDLKTLERVWRDADEDLRTLVPSPAVYSPHLLTQYLESLIRYEQLVRYGAQANAGHLLAQIKKLRATMHEKKRLEDLASTPNALPLPAVLGLLDTPLLQDAGDMFQKLWAADKSKRDQAWRAIKQRHGGDNLLNVKLSGWLMKKAIDDPKDLPKACEILRQLVSPGERPTEAHHLVMWQRDLEELDKSNPPKELDSALGLRRYAEEVALGVKGEKRPREKDDPIMPTEVDRPHPYSEIVHYWIQAQVEQADALRREGQDLMFSAAQKDHAKASDRFKEAEDRYDKAFMIARRIRFALEARSEVMALLPFYSRWLASRRSLYDADLSNVNVFQNKVINLWKNTHELNELLEKSPAADKIAGTVEQLTDLAGKVRKDFDAVKATFNGHCGESRGQLQSDWHALEEALAVPLIPVSTRLKMLDQVRATSHKLNTDTNARVGNVPDHPNTEREAQEGAYREGRMELAMLGKGLFPKTNEPAREDWDKMEALLKDVRGDRWQEAAMRFSEQTSARWLEMAKRIDQYTAESRKKGNLDEAATQLAWADRVCRQIDGAGAAAVQFNPVEEARRLNMHHLFLWLAERTLKDHWYDEKNLPYYRDIGQRYVSDARKLAGDKDSAVFEERIARAKAREKELRAPVNLAFDWALRDKDQEYEKTEPAEVDITSEKEFALHYRVVHSEGLPPGSAVVYFEPKAITSADDAKLAALQKPQLRQIDAKASPPVSVTDLVNPNYKDLFRREVKPVTTTRVEPKTCSMRGLWRGYRFRRDTNIHFHPRGNVIIDKDPLPDRAALHVFASDQIHRKYNPQQGAIAIVVDYSGSMRFHTKKLPNSNDPDERSPRRIDVARQALKQMLENLPAGLEVSLWTFQGYPRDPKQDVKIKRVEKTRRWKEGKNGDARTFVAALKKAEPNGGTPLLEAMTEARDELLDFQNGRRTMVVLTDGVPNDPAREMAGLRGRLRRMFFKKDILVHVVGFKVDEIDDNVDGKGAKQCLKEFIKAVQELDVPGNFYRASEPDQLIDALMKTLEWHFQIGPPTKRRAIPLNKRLLGLIMRDRYPNKWLSVQPGTYAFWENKLFPDDSQYVTLNPGQLQMYELQEDGLRPASFLKRLESGDKAWPEDQDLGWRMAVCDNLRDKLSQSVLVLVENTLSTRQEVRPGQVWLELQNPDGTPVTGLRWGSRLGYPTPAWKLEATRAPDQPKGPVWSRVQTWVRATRVPGESVPRGKRPLSDFVNQKTVVERVPVIIESINVEEFPVVDELGRRDAKKKMWCLVVRLSHPKGQPIFAEPVLNVDMRDKGRFEGYEHHYYTEAGTGRGKYTGIFWFGPGEKPEIDSRFERLDLYSVNALKGDKQTTQRFVFDLNRPAEAIANPVQRFLKELNLE
jgi:hypothetical protein